MKVTGLAKTWEANEFIRDRLRQKRKLCIHQPDQRYCEPSRPNCIENTEVLIPALELLSVTPKFALPHLDPLQTEIRSLCAQLSVNVDADYIYTASVEVKRMLGFIKRRANRGEVTKAR